MLELHPEDLKKQWLHRRVGSRNSNKGGVSQALLLFKLSFSIPSLLSFSILPLSWFPLSSLSSLLAFWSIVCPKTHFMFHSDSILIQAPLARGYCALPRSCLFLLLLLLLFFCCSCFFFFWRGEGDFLPYFASSNIHPLKHEVFILGRQRIDQ